MKDVSIEDLLTGAGILAAKVWHHRARADDPKDFVEYETTLHDSQGQPVYTLTMRLALDNDYPGDSDVGVKASG